MTPSASPAASSSGGRIRDLVRTAFPGTGKRPEVPEHHDDTTPMDAALQALEGTLGSLVDEAERFAGLVGRAQSHDPVVERFRARIDGSTVVFTGTGLRPAATRAALADRFGFTAERRVTTTTDLLVVASATTSTGQVERARSLGVPVLEEQTFLDRLRAS